MTQSQIGNTAASTQRQVSILRVDVDATVARIVHSAAGLTTGEGTRRLTAELQRYTEALLTAALGQYTPIVDGAGNLLFFHLECAWPQWGDGNQPPRECRRCAVPTGAWTPAYARSNVEVRRGRQPRIPAEPALVAALRGAFSDTDLAVLADDLDGSRREPVRRLVDVLTTAAGAL
ncbi:hypothetical protein ACIBTV_25620 [Micromonospora sp. NPDC049366]|uniref:hypothetical protein n=1 Tax=Micromonospora sp. NPDC049366 TaxID=3364271 RepID=UPI0037A2896D